jgi:hypothetical protein
MTNRELTAVIFLVILVGFLVLKSRSDDDLRKSLRGVVGSLASPWILIPILLYAGVITLAVAVAERLDLWTLDLLKSTVLWFVLSGLVLLLNVNEAIQKPDFFRRALFKTLGVGAVVEFLAALRSFPLWVEVPGQGLAIIFAMMAAFTERKPEHAPARKVANGYLILFGLSVISWSIAGLIGNWSDLDHAMVLREYLIPIWLTPIALVFVYVFALVAAYQGAFLRMRIWEKDRPLLKQRLAIICRSNVRLSYLRRLSGLAPQRIARTSGFRAAWREVGILQKEEKEREAEEDAAQRRLIDNAGLVGADSSGRQLDQREFEETRKALMWLATCHMGHYRNHGKRYRPDLLAIVESHFARDGLPEDHGIEMYVRPDGQSWYATRQTISGWWFAIGAAGEPPDQWLFDGPEAPGSFPGLPVWDQFGGGEASLNWD